MTVVEDGPGDRRSRHPELTESASSATYDMVAPADGKPIGGSLTADAALSPPRDRLTDHEWSAPFRFSVVGQALAAAGTLTLQVDGTSTVLAERREL